MSDLAASPMGEPGNERELLWEDARRRAEEVRQWADLNGGELDWLIEDETVREAVEKALWLAPEVERLVDLLRTAQIEPGAAGRAVIALSEMRGWALGASEGGYRWMLERIDVALDAFCVTEEVRRVSGDVLEGRPPDA